MFSEPVSIFPFKDIVTIAKNSVIESQPVSNSGLSAAGVSQRPVPGMEFVNPSPGIAAHIRRVVPGAVIHSGPTHELRARIVGVAVIIEEIRERKASHRNGVARHRALTGELILFALKWFLLLAESEIV